MKLGGVPERIEIKPETDDEKAAFQKILDRSKVARDDHLLIYWGDSEEFGGALIINTVGPVEYKEGVQDAGEPTVMKEMA